ncbi:hypothetical protein G5I_03364 [Acromyrmex echinatior]|uniref:SWIM-type domain-containing protein n=2 Tax=Acromyrmex echinatior TaxID=103372 RepID=F4WCT4_ACREC|nr:hypothetical protein G5I_03364 [Acromyrmex echinatior]
MIHRSKTNYRFGIDIYGSNANHEESIPIGKLSTNKKADSIGLLTRHLPFKAHLLNIRKIRITIICQTEKLLAMWNARTACTICVPALCLSARDVDPGDHMFLTSEDLDGAKIGDLISLVHAKQTEDIYNLLYFCLQISNMRDPPYQVKININANGTMNSAECTCKAGLNVKCKHIVPMLLFCNRRDIEKLDKISCTDKKCVWNFAHTAALDTYKAAPLAEHKCFNIEKSKARKAHLLNRNYPSFHRHMYGRHNSKGKILMQTNISLPDILSEINAIVGNLSSAQMLELSNMSLDIPPKECIEWIRIFEGYSKSNEHLTFTMSDNEIEKENIYRERKNVKIGEKRKEDIKREKESNLEESFPQTVQPKYWLKKTTIELKLVPPNFRFLLAALSPTSATLKQCNVFP